MSAGNTIVGVGDVVPLPPPLVAAARNPYPPAQMLTTTSAFACAATSPRTQGAERDDNTSLPRTERVIAASAGESSDDPSALLPPDWGDRHSAPPRTALDCLHNRTPTKGDAVPDDVAMDTAGFLVVSWRPCSSRGRTRGPSRAYTKDGGARRSHRQAACSAFGDGAAAAAVAERRRGRGLAYRARALHPLHPSLPAATAS